MHQAPQLPTTFSEALPEPMPVPFVNTLFLVGALGLIAATAQALRTLPYLAPPPPPVAYRGTPLPLATTAPHLLLALNQAQTPTAAFQLTPAQKNLAPVAVHVAQELLTDQLNGVMLKLSLAQQVGEALLNASR